LGLSPREAGHLYSRQGTERAKASLVETRLRHEGSVTERQTRFADRLTQQRGKPVSVEESRETYEVHNYAKTYTKARLTLRTDDGRYIKRNLTLTSADRLTRGEARRLVDRYVEQGNLSPLKVNTETATLVSVSFEEIILYPDFQL